MKVARIWILLIAMGSLTACSDHPLSAPCPGFGSHCNKTSINSWDNYQ